MDYAKLNRIHTKGASVEEISRDFSYNRLSIPAGKADQYRLAQIDDYAKDPRRQFPDRFPLSLSLSARASSNSIAGTWGFGFWNYPFGMSLGFGGSRFGLPALPNAVWFFGASQESYLSFRPPTGSTKSDERVPYQANGFLAQSFRSPMFHPWLIAAGLVLPFSRRLARRLLGRVIADGGLRLSVDVTQWHRYRLGWHEDRVSFEVDGAPVFESRVSPKPPLGLVIWVDNQYAAFTPEGKLRFGILENPEPAWLEIKDLELK